MSNNPSFPPSSPIGQPASTVGLPLPSNQPFAQFQQPVIAPPPWVQPTGAPQAAPWPSLTWPFPPQGVPPASAPFQIPGAIPQGTFNPLQALREAHLPMPCTKKLKELLALPPIDPNELFLHRLLCRHGLGLLVGPSGLGKSTFIMAGAVKWAWGIEHFGFKPLRPLRLLVAQAENDLYDMREQFGGCIRSMKLTDEQFEFINERISIVTINSVVGDEFCEVLRRLIIEHRADLVVIDPALAYLGGDANSQVEVGRFLRKGIAPVLAETNSAAILVHHTPKLVFSKGAASNRSDAYAGAGSAEWANFSRLVFGINPTDVADHFELFLGKRGRRAGWKDAEGNTITKRFIRHAREDGDLLWSEVSDEEFESLKPTDGGEKHEATADEFLSLFPATYDGTDPKAALLSTDSIKAMLKAKGWAVLGYAKLRDALVERGELDVLVGHSNSKLTGRAAIVASARALQPSKAK